MDEGARFSVPFNLQLAGNWRCCGRERKADENLLTLLRVLAMFPNRTELGNEKVRVAGEEGLLPLGKVLSLSWLGRREYEKLM
jgi:hypothetical protein